MSCSSDLTDSARAAGRSFKTSYMRLRGLKKLLRFLRDRNIEIRDWGELTHEQLIAWIQAERAAGTGPRTCRILLAATLACLREGRSGIQPDATKTEMLTGDVV